MDKTYFDTFLATLAGTKNHQGVLGGEFVIFPPNPDYGYSCTPKNALTFASMGVDGVHYAILSIEGEIRDDSPVIHVSPMDSDCYLVLADSFLSYLADGCDVTLDEMDEVFRAERDGKARLLRFLRKHFDAARLVKDEVNDRLSQYLELIVMK